MSKLHSFSNFLTGIIDNVEISKIKTGPNLLRQGENNIQELANSIRQKGLLQPILVRTKDGFYEIVAGSRRYEACKTLHYKKITCHLSSLSGLRQLFRNVRISCLFISRNVFLLLPSDDERLLRTIT